MSYLTITGDTKGVSSEKIVAGLNANGLACTGSRATGEGKARELRFALDDGAGGDYRGSLPPEVLLMRVADGVSRAGLFIYSSAEVKARSAVVSGLPSAERAERYDEMCDRIILVTGTGSVDASERELLNVAYRQIPPPSGGPARDTLEWAEAVLAR